MTLKNKALNEVVEGLIRYARPVMLEQVRLDSCIAMTRVAIEVLKHFGHEARHCRAAVMLWNKEFEEGLLNGTISLDKPLPKDQEDLGAWSVGVGFGPKTEVGHYVALCEGLLIDLSIDQGSRPHKGICATPFAGLFTGEPKAVYEFPEGGRAIYHLDLDWPPPTDSPDWTNFHSRYSKTVGKIIRLIQE